MKYPPIEERTLIGYAERVDLPDWGIRDLRAKVDTGARTSALHVDNIARLSNDRVQFDVVVNRKTHRKKHVVTRLTRVGQVRSSSGRAETRYFVSTTLRLGEVEKEIEISLASRHSMQFRMLLGRSALGHDFVIDPGRRYAQSDHHHHGHGHGHEGKSGRKTKTDKRKKPKGKVRRPKHGERA